VGYIFEAEQARVVAAEFGWLMREEAPGAFRHVVPSPEPRHIVDISLIQTVAQTGAVVIAGGGGGIPVIREADGTRRGVEAVIDKDLATAHLATVLRFETLLILTGAPAVALHFGQPTQRYIDHVTASELRHLQQQGHFPDGSMGPKVEAALRFVERGGRRAIIADLFEAEAALAGLRGTQISPG